VSNRREDECEWCGQHSAALEWLGAYQICPRCAAFEEAAKIAERHPCDLALTIAAAIRAQGIETAKPPRREAGLARKGESPVAESDAPE